MLALFDKLKPTPRSRIPSQLGVPTDVYVVCWVDPAGRKFAIANYTRFLGYQNAANQQIFQTRKTEPHKPKLFNQTEIGKLFERDRDANGFPMKVYLPPFLSGMSDYDIAEKFSQEWIKRRDESLKQLESLLNDEFIHQYLMGNGSHEIAECAKANNFKSPTSITRKLNCFIGLGKSKNSLMPFGLQNTGLNYFHSDKSNYVKRGRNDGDSGFRGIHQSDKTLIKKVAKQFGIHGRSGCLYIRDIYIEFLIQYAKVEGLPSPELKDNGHYDMGYPASMRISEATFRYHYEILLPMEQRLRLEYGEHGYNKNHKARTGEARDGVHGASHLVELDHTELDLHVRLPGVHDRRYSAGRPYLCLAICVYTRYIMGFSLSFRPPCWDNVADCIINTITDKVEFAAHYGVSLRQNDWPCNHLGYAFRIDNGSEYPAKQENELISSPFEFQRIEQVSKGRGDLKSAVERHLGIVVPGMAKNPGGMEKGREAVEQDASQQALLVLEDVFAGIIDFIVLHNKTANREHLIDKDMLEDGVGGCPLAMWQYSLKNQMSGGNPIAPEQIPFLRYTLLRKERATVSSIGLTLNSHSQLKYHNVYADSENWYLHAKHGRGMTIDVACTSGCVDYVYFRTDDGEIIPFKLKSQCSRFEGMSWFEFEQSQKERKATIQGKTAEREAGSVYNRLRLQERIAKNEDEQVGVPNNTQTSYQTTTSQYNSQMQQDQLKRDAAAAHDQLSGEFPSSDHKVEESQDNTNTNSGQKEFF